MTSSPTDQELLAEIAAIFSNAYRENDSKPAPSLLASLMTLCALCGTPVESHMNCYKCNLAIKNADWARCKPTVIAPLAYAVSGAQSGLDVHKYKEVSGGAPALRRMKILLYLFVVNHLQCIGKDAGIALTHVAAVPSGKGRTYNPLVNSFAPFLSKQGLGIVELERLAPTRPAGTRQAAIDSELFRVEALSTEDHVLVLEDTWVTGANCLSLAIALSKAGAGAVSIVPMARYLNTGHSLTTNWLSTNSPLPAYDPGFCPVSKSSVCP